MDKMVEWVMMSVRIKYCIHIVCFFFDVNKQPEWDKWPIYPSFKQTWNINHDLLEEVIIIPSVILPPARWTMPITTNANPVKFDFVVSSTCFL